MRRVKYRPVRKVQPYIFEYTGNHRTDPVEMQLFIYNSEKFEEFDNISISEVKTQLVQKPQNDCVIWLNIHGLHHISLIQEIGALLNLENFIISDILNTSRRTLIEEFDDLLFFSVKSILQSDDSENVKVEQISFLLKDNILVSFQEKRSDFFSHIRERIRTKMGIVRKKRNDYLLYQLLDAVIENFFITIETGEDKIEQLLTASKVGSKTEILERIERSREQFNFLKRSIIPLRDAIYSLKSKQEDESFTVINKSSYSYFARLHQKCLEILDQIDYDMSSLESASNVFFSSQSQRMNQIMKTLTIFSVIFMPLTFIVGVYGMNFEVMPELRDPNGYFKIWIIMIVIAIGMTVYFRRKKWF